MKLLQVDSIPNFYRDEESGIYYVRRMVKGKVIWRSTNLTSRKAAWTRANEILGDLNDRKVGWAEKAVPTLSEWWTKYRAAKKKSPKTWKREEEIMEQHWLPQFGRLRLDEITQNQIERQLNWRRKKAKEGTVTREQSLLHAVFEAALDDDLLARNPLRKIPRTPYATRQRVVSIEEQKQLLDVMSPMFGRWFQFMLGTGIRLDECRGLNTETDIDWVNSSITVTGKGHNGEPKIRDVPLLSDVLISIIKAQIEENEGDPKHHRRERHATLWGQEPSYFRKELTKMCSRANVKGFSPHTLRHSFATRYLQSGGDIFVLSRILGHYSVEVTQRVYAHLLSKDNARLSKHVDLKLQAM